MLEDFNMKINRIIHRINILCKNIMNTEEIRFKNLSSINFINFFFVKYVLSSSYLTFYEEVSITGGIIVQDIFI